MNNKSFIAVCDSGLGGISVLNHLVKVLPNENFIYMADSKNAPYGKKTPIEVANLIENVFDTLLLQDIKTIVVACNTASTQFKSFGHKDKYSEIPMFFVEPNMSEAIHSEKSKNILLLATKVTCESDFVKNLLVSEGINEKNFASGKFLSKTFNINNKNLTLIAGEDIVPFVEKYDIDSKECIKTIDCMLNNCFEIDSVILGCTHFPFVKHIINDVLTKKGSKNINFFDNASVISENVKEYLEKNNLLNTENNKIHNIKILDSSKDITRLPIFNALIKAPGFTVDFL